MCVAIKHNRRDRENEREPKFAVDVSPVQPPAQDLGGVEADHLTGD